MEVEVVSEPIELRLLDIDGSPFEEVVAGERVVRVLSGNAGDMLTTWQDRLEEFRRRQMHKEAATADAIIDLCSSAKGQDLALYVCSALQLSALYHFGRKIGVVIGFGC